MSIDSNKIKNYYKYKAEKYRTKNLRYARQNDIEDLSGGHGTTVIKYDSPNIEQIQNTLVPYILLDSKENMDADSISDHFKQRLLNDLDNLLLPVHGKINVDFLNNFKSHILADTKGTYAISNGQFINTNLNYEVQSQISASTAAGDIYILKKTNNGNHNLPDELVLKIFRDTINIEDIKDYLSLEITRITLDNQSSSIPEVIPQTNYIEITDSYFERIYNFNKGYLKLEDQIQTYGSEYSNNNNHLYLSIKNDNFINEIMINLLIEKILKTLNNYKYNHYVKYYNYYITRVDGYYRGCVIMDKMDGTLNHLVGQYMNTGQRDDDMNKILNSCVKQLVPSLLALKTKNYQFTHTDLKAENVFYKEVQVENVNDVDNIYHIINNNGKNIYYKFYIADFDKSSIRYHGIRFYNDYSSSHSSFGMFNPQSILQVLMDYTQDDNNFIISRGIGSIPTEVFAMRYTMYPFFLGFDFQSLCMSLTTYRRKNFAEDINGEYSQLLDILFGDYKDYFISSYQQYQTPYKGDFTKLMDPLIVNALKIPKINMDNLLEKYKVSQSENFTKGKIILLSKNENKLVLSLPFVPRDIHLKWAYMSTSIIYLPEKNKSLRLYAQLSADQKELLSTTFEPLSNQNYSDSNYVVNYTGNVSMDGRYNYITAFVSNSENIICITNRYSSTGITGTYLYEWDRVPENHVIKIYEIYRPIFFPESN